MQINWWFWNHTTPITSSVILGFVNYAFIRTEPRKQANQGCNTKLNSNKRDWDNSSVYVWSTLCESISSFWIQVLYNPDAPLPTVKAVQVLVYRKPTNMSDLALAHTRAHTRTHQILSCIFFWSLFLSIRQFAEPAARIFWRILTHRFDVKKIRIDFAQTESAKLHWQT